MRAIVLCGVLASALTACARGQDGTDDELEAALRATDNRLQQAVMDRDLEAIVSFYADDAVLMPAAEPLVSGKDAIRDEWRHILNIPDYESTGSLIRVDVSRGGDLGYSMGTYQAKMRGEDGALVTEPGKWLTVWRRQPGGEWRIVADTYNTDIPPPDHK